MAFIDKSPFVQGRLLELLAKGRRKDGSYEGATASELSLLMPSLKPSEITRHLRELVRRKLVEPVRVMLPGASPTQDPRLRGLQATVSRKSFLTGNEENVYRLVKLQSSLNHSHHSSDNTDAIWLPHEAKKEQQVASGDI